MTANSVFAGCPCKMVDLVRDVASVCKQLRALEEKLAPLAGDADYQESLRCIQSLLGALEDEFELVDVGSKPATNEATADAKLKRLRVDVSRQKRKYEESQAALTEAIADKMGGRIQNIWFVRVGLARPTLPMRSLRDFCRDFPVVETANISYEYIGATRDAMCEIIKQINQSAVVEAVAALTPIVGCTETTPVFLPHIHDESLMRVRSSVRGIYVAESASAAGSPDLRMSRARFSKIQNNVLTAVVANTEMEIYTELQPLLKKDGATIATAIIQTTSGLLEECVKALARNQHGCKQLRVVHIVVGDGVNTNENAMKRL